MASLKLFAGFSVSRFKTVFYGQSAEFFSGPVKKFFIYRWKRAFRRLYGQESDYIGMAAIGINVSPRHRQESQQRHHHACGLHGGREFSGWRLGLHRQQAGSGGLRLWPDAPAADEYRCRQGHAVADAERPGHTEQTAGDRLFGQRHGKRSMPGHFGADRQRHLREKIQSAVTGSC